MRGARHGPAGHPRTGSLGPGLLTSHSRNHGCWVRWRRITGPHHILIGAYQNQTGLILLTTLRVAVTHQLQWDAPIARRGFQRLDRGVFGVERPPGETVTQLLQYIS